MPDVVFPTGIVETGDSYLVYYGAADAARRWLSFRDEVLSDALHDGVRRFLTADVDLQAVGIAYSGTRRMPHDAPGLQRASGRSERRGQPALGLLAADQEL